MTPELWERLTRSVRDRSDTHPCHECSGSGGVPAEWRFHAFGTVRVEAREGDDGG